MHFCLRDDKITSTYTEGSWAISRDHGPDSSLHKKEVKKFLKINPKRMFLSAVLEICSLEANYSLLALTGLKNGSYWWTLTDQLNESQFFFCALSTVNVSGVWTLLCVPKAAKDCHIYGLKFKNQAPCLARFCYC